MFVNMFVKRNSAFSILILTLICLVLTDGKGIRDSIVLPPLSPGPNTPTCHSYSSLCHLAYNITEKGSSQIFHSYSQICKCPDGLECPTDWFDMSNSLVKAFKNAGEEMQVKVSYCQLNLPSRRCLQNEPAVTLRGRGPFQFEVFQDFKCKCHRPLYAHQSWQDGPYDYVEYSCGKPRCGMNKQPEKKCTKLTYVDEENYFHEYLCRCKWYEECTGITLPTAYKPVTYKHCQSVHYNDYQRKRHRRNRRKANKTRHTGRAT